MDLNILKKNSNSSKKYVKMKYSNKNVKRQDRLLDEKSAKKILANGEYGVLSMLTNENKAYGIPINYVWNTKHSIYLHCALDGRKIESIDLHNKVSFCIIGKTKIISNKFTTAYESIILDCIAYRNLQNEEKINALELLIDKYSPENKAQGEKYIKKLINRTEIIRLDIIEYSGKAKNN